MKINTSKKQDLQFNISSVHSTDFFLESIYIRRILYYFRQIIPQMSANIIRRMFIYRQYFCRYLKYDFVSTTSNSMRDFNVALPLLKKGIF